MAWTELPHPRHWRQNHWSSVARRICALISPLKSGQHIVKSSLEEEGHLVLSLYMLIPKPLPLLTLRDLHIVIMGSRGQKERDFIRACHGIVVAMLRASLPRMTYALPWRRWLRYKLSVTSAQQMAS